MEEATKAVDLAEIPEMLSEETFGPAEVEHGPGRITMTFIGGRDRMLEVRSIMQEMDELDGTRSKVQMRNVTFDFEVRA